MFSILALKIGSEGDKISRKKLSRLTPRQFFSRNFVTLVANFEPKLKTWSRQIMFYTNIPLSASKFASYFGNFSIKHDLARSCFKFWLKIGDEGDKISRKKTGEALAETVFSRNFVTLGADFEGHNWKHDLARLCFMLYTPSYGNSR